MNSKTGIGHITAVVTVMIWGTTFISTKILLADFNPIEILFFRFVLGYAALILADPRPLRGTDLKQNLMFAGAGLCGVCMYYLLENIALTYTMASNVGVIVSSAPFFTVILSKIFLKEEERLSPGFAAGFVVAMAGIFLINFNGSKMHLNPMGDLLALVAAFVWACYSVFIKKVNSYGYGTIQTTRRTFTYGILFMIPALFFMDFRLEFGRLTYPLNILNLVYLGLGASALCFATWNFATKVLGVVKSSVYIYLTPVVSVLMSALILKEQITALSLLGTVLTLSGLVISELRFGKRGEKARENKVVEGDA